MGLLDFNDPQSLSQLGAALGLLTARVGDNRGPQMLMQLAQQQEAARQRALQEQLIKQQIASGEIDVKSKTQSFADSQAARDVLRNMNPGQPPAGPEGAMQPPYRPAPAPGGGMMVAPTQASPGGQAPAVTGSGKNQTFAYYKSIGDKMASQGLPEQAQKYYDLAEKYRPKLKDTKTLTDPATKQRVTVNFYEDGTREVVPFGPDQEKAHFADTGGQITPLDPFTGQPRGQGLGKTVSPDTQFSGGVTMRGQNMTNALGRDRLAFEQAQGNKPQVVTSPNGDVYAVDPRSATGRTVTGPDGQPMTVGAKLTESQAKASVYYGQMRNASDAANKVVVGGFNPAGKDQASYAQARAASELSDNHPVMAAALQVMTPAKAQKYQQSAEQWAESYLRYNTGAATNHSEIVRYARIFFPMPGDSVEVVAQKNQARTQAEQMMRIAANNGAAQVDNAIGGKPSAPNDPLGIR